MADLETENRELRQRLAGIDECTAAFIEACEGVIHELDTFCDACAGDAALHERARAAATAAGERMHLAIHAIGQRFASYRACNSSPSDGDNGGAARIRGE